MVRGCRLSWSGAASIALAGLLGCASTANESLILKETADGSINTAQLRMQVRSLAKPFSGIIEGAADSVLAHAVTPEERIAGLRIKTDGVPAFQGALFEPDPVAAIFETAALIIQTRDFIEKGPGAGLSPLVREQILGAMNQMRFRLRQMGEQIGANQESSQRFWATAESWASEHPITTSFAARETTQALLAEYLASEPRGLRAIAGRFDESLADLSFRFDLYGEYIAKQVRWQAELLLEESLTRDLPQRMVESAGPVAVGLRDLPFDVDAQRELILAAMRAERALLLDWAHGERLDTLEWAGLERQAIAAMVGKERQLVLDALREERETLLTAAREERAAMMQDLSRVVADAVVSSRRHVVDHLFLRAAQLLAVVLPLVFVGAGLLIRYARSPR